MNGTLSLSGLFSGANARAMAAPIFIVLILAMLVLPLPPFALDMLFTFNIALSIMVLLVGLSTKKALEFAAFPTVLLLSTLLRLSLNVASTRVVLLEGHTGPDAAGKVMQRYSSDSASAVVSRYSSFTKYGWTPPRKSSAKTTTAATRRPWRRSWSCSC